MEYTVRLHPNVARQISQWGLSDFLLVEVYLALREVLARDPLNELHRDVAGNGSLFVFERIDPQSAGVRHLFQFRVFSEEDEQHLLIVRGSYWRY